MSAFLDTDLPICAQGTGAESEVARQAILVGGVIGVQVSNERAAVLRRKSGFERDDTAQAIAGVRAALDPVRPIDSDTHTKAAAARLGARSRRWNEFASYTLTVNRGWFPVGWFSFI